MSKPTAELLSTIYDKLFAAYGPQHWWPAESSTEVVIGAILTQNTAWRNVERAIENLRRAGCLDFRRLRDIPQERLAELIRPSGTYRIKADRLRSFVDRLWEDYHGSLEAMLDGEVAATRQRLLSIHGIGPETADVILLYAGGTPTFVVDRYTLRILRRHRLLRANSTYATAQNMFHRAVRPDKKVYNEYHALLVALGKKHCQAQALCKGCPLEDLPHDAD